MTKSNQIKFLCPECVRKRIEKAVHYKYPFCTFCYDIGFKYITTDYPTGMNREHARVAYNRYLNSTADFD